MSYTKRSILRSGPRPKITGNIHMDIANLPLRKEFLNEHQYINTDPMNRVKRLKIAIKALMKQRSIWLSQSQ